MKKFDHKIGDTIKDCPVCGSRLQNQVAYSGNPRDLLCERCAEALAEPTNGLGGTDNVAPLFPDRPTAAGLPPQPEVVEQLESFLHEAVTGKVTGIIIFGFDQVGGHRTAMVGKVKMSDSISAIEQLKFLVLARDYTKQLETNMGPK